MAKILGIDLGTTNSAMAAMDAGEATIIHNAEGQRVTPSVVAFTPSGERLVGQTAKRQAVVNSQNTVFSVKRLMGRRADDPEIANIAQHVTYELVPGPNGDARVKIPATGKTYTPQEISAMILQKLKADAEAYLGEKVTDAVITVPAYFNDSQRQATKDAGKIAGLNVLRIINEPTAAALAYGLQKTDETILVFDLGGGTFDVSVLTIGDGVVEVQSTAGDTFLGGDDWDERVVQWIADGFKSEQGIDLREDRQALQRLKEAAEKAKIELSSATETEINLPFVTADATGPKHLQMKLTRAKFDQITEDLVERLRVPFSQALADAGLTAAQVDEVVLVGGSTRMPMVQELVRSLTGRDPHKGVNPDEVVAVGAAIQGGVLGGEVRDVVLLDVTPLTLGVETLGGVSTPLIERNTTIPTRKSEIFSTADDNQTAVDIKVLQGERPMARDNNLLGQFRLEGIPSAPRGMPQIEVSFDIDANGILNVAAQDKATGREQKITITASTNLSKDDVSNMVQQAELHAADDKKARDLAEARNRADTLIYQTEKTLMELADKVPAEDREGIEGDVRALREAMDSDDTERLRQLTEKLQQASHALSQQLYQAREADSGEPGSDSADAPVEPAQDDVVEGEFREA